MANAVPSPELALLRLLQITDSQFPTGSFAHSGGLETYAQRGLDPVGLRTLLLHGVTLGAGRLDAAALVLAYRAEGATALALLGDELAAWMVVPSLRDASLRLGERTLKLLGRLYPGVTLPDLPAPFQPLVLGSWGRQAALDVNQLTLATLHGAVVGNLAAATRCMRLSPEMAQEILVGLHPVLLRVCAEVIDAPRAALWSATPGADIAAHLQRHLYSRLFQT